MSRDLVSIKSSFHGRERRQERQISKDDAKLARKYGMEELSSTGHRKYTFRGTVFVVNSARNQEVTCYHSHDYASPFSGSRVVLPQLYPMMTEYAIEQQVELHETLRKSLLLQQKKQNKSKTQQQNDYYIASHTIFCVSMSSLMRQDDVNGARCRSDAVWAALAKGFVHSLMEKEIDMQQKQQQKQKHHHHLVSVVALMEEDSNSSRAKAKIVLRWEPVDGVLFDKLLYLRDWSALRPQGRQAVFTNEAVHCIETMLKKTTGSGDGGGSGSGNPSITTTLVFIASDDLTVSVDKDEKVDKTAVKRLQELTEDLHLRRIGIHLGHESDDCSALRQLVTVKQPQHKNNSDANVVVPLSRLDRATLELDSLIHGLSNVAAEVEMAAAEDLQESPTATTTATCTFTGRLPDSSTSRITRRKEPLTAATLGTRAAATAATPTTTTTTTTVATTTTNWTTGVIRKVYMWSERASDLVPLVDRRCTSCYAEVGTTKTTTIRVVDSDADSAVATTTIPDPSKGWLCASCESRHYCVDCMTHFTCHLGSIECNQLRMQRQAGQLLGVPHPPSYSIEIEQGPSASAAVFAGQKIRFLDAGTSTGDKRETSRSCRGPIMVCHKLGQEQWETVCDAGLGRHYRQVCQAKAAARRIAGNFIDALARHASSSSSAALPTMKTVRVLEAMVVELEGGGCFYINLKEETAATVSHSWPATCDDDDDDHVSMVLEALSHYSALSRHSNHHLVLPSKVDVNEREIVLVDVVVHNSDTERRQATEAFMRSHSCNFVCHLLNMSTTATTS